jgi:acyl-CoA synthetase (AMP-forming)/AMP-acid ligase II
MHLGAMQDWELRVSLLIDHAASQHATREIVTRWNDGSESRTTWAGVRHDALRMVQALQRLGIAPGDRVATLAMNHGPHLVTWYGATGAGCILHTINPRLFDEQLEYIANHAEDRVLLYDAVFQPIVDRMRPRWTSIEHYICFDSADREMHFADWIGAEDGNAEWVTGSERDPCMLCYTSGTTGHPKGVLFEHRSNLLHTYAAISMQSLGIDSRTCVLPVVPMFHANDWAFPWAAAAVGAKLVYCSNNEAANLCDLIEQEARRRADSLAQPVSAYRCEGRAAAGGPYPRDLRRLGNAARDRRAADCGQYPHRTCLGHDRDVANRNGRL